MRDDEQGLFVNIETLSVPFLHINHLNKKTKISNKKKLLNGTGEF